MKPIIFLDIDGVLHIAGDPPMTLNAQCVAALNWLTDFGVQIVLSSSWRFLADIRGRLVHAGVTGKILGGTPILPCSDSTRGDEIREWLGLHAERPPFVILDDDADMGEFTPYLIRTSFHAGGLTLPLAELALTRLTAQQKNDR